MFSIEVCLTNQPNDLPGVSTFKQNSDGTTTGGKDGALEEDAEIGVAVIEAESRVEIAPGADEVMSRELETRSDTDELISRELETRVSEGVKADDRSALLVLPLVMGTLSVVTTTVTVVVATVTNTVATKTVTVGIGG